MFSKLGVISLASTLASFAFACGNAPPSTGAGSGTTSVEGNSSVEEAVVHETVVRFDAQGQTQIHRVDVPRAQYESQVAIRLGKQPAAAQTVTQTNTGEKVDTVSSAFTTVDSNCATQDLWLFSAEGCNSHLLCLVGWDNNVDFDLRTVPFGDGTNWDTKVASYWPGYETGYMVCADGIHTCEGPWNAWGPCTNGGGFPRYVALTD